MLSKLFEWYRVVNPQPGDDVIQKRTASAKEIVDELDEADTVGPLMDCAAGLVTGFNKERPPEIASSILNHIRNHQAAFPSSTAEADVELRVLAAVALGEIMSGAVSADGIRDDALVIATSIVSCLLIRPPTKARYLDQLLAELNQLATRVLERAAAGRRGRASLPLANLDALEIPNIAAVRQTLVPQLKSLFQELQDQAAADREELDVLWWIYSGVSKTTGKKLRDMDPGAIALCCGLELADLIIPPPPGSAKQMVIRAIRDYAAVEGVTSLKKVVAAWPKELISLAVPTEVSTKELVSSRPSLFPLTWICIRAHDSGGNSGWGEEFTRKTGITDGRQLSIEEWAVQVFNERAAQRTLADGNG